MKKAIFLVGVLALLILGISAAVAIGPSGGTNAASRGETCCKDAECLQSRQSVSEMQQSEDCQYYGMGDAVRAAQATANRTQAMQMDNASECLGQGPAAAGGTTGQYGECDGSNCPYEECPADCEQRYAHGDS